MIKLSKSQVLLMHEELIEQTGVINGVRDVTLLESALSAPFQEFEGEELFLTLSFCS